MSHFEIEIKSLLGAPKQAEALVEQMQQLDPLCVCVGSSIQLNHYFESGDINKLFQVMSPLLSGEQRDKFRMIAEVGNEFSIRTRQKDDEVLLVIKASIDEGTSANGVKRMEFEESINLSLQELDDLLLQAGYAYQAKWSREREEYLYKGVNVCLDKNAGYGYLAEFEKIVNDAREAEAVRLELNALMQELGVEELNQDRLARMFAHYNTNWQDYYGTDRTFIIE